MEGIKHEIALYVDGSCKHNGTDNGIMGIGIRAVYIPTGLVKEVHKNLGKGTNNLAELLAIEYGLRMIEKERDSTMVTIYTDSAYAIGCITQNWKIKTVENLGVTIAIKELLKEFGCIIFTKVKGHSKHRGNDAADKLAKKGSSNDGK